MPEIEETQKVQRQNRATKKARFSGFLDEKNMEWLKQKAEQDARSTASLLNLIIRRMRQNEEQESST